MESFHQSIVAKERILGCHPPFGSISKGEVLALLFLLIFTAKCNVSNKFHFRITLRICSNYHRWGFFAFSWPLLSNKFPCSPAVFPSPFPLSSKTNLKSNILIQANFLSTTPLIYHIAYFLTGHKVLQIPHFVHNEHSHSNPCLSLKWSVTTIFSSALWASLWLISKYFPLNSVYIHTFRLTE